MYLCGILNLRAPEKFNKEETSHNFWFSGIFDILIFNKRFDSVMKDFPNMKIKNFPPDLDIESTPVFHALLERFNEIYGSSLTTRNILSSKVDFDAFFEFLLCCSFSGKITIPDQEQRANFMISLERLRKKYNLMLRSIEQYFNEIFKKIYYPQGLTKLDPPVVKDRYRFEQAYSLMRLLMGNMTRENGKRRFEHLKWTMEILLRELDNPDMNHPNIDQILIALLHDIQEDLPEYADVVRKVFGDYVANGVDVLSKKDWVEYLTEEEKEGCIPLLNGKKMILGEAYIVMVAKHPDSAFTAVDKADEDELKKYMNTEQRTQYDMIETQIKPFMDLAKPRRNKDYFGHMEDLNDDYLAVKLADRIHNLRDMDGGVRREKVIRKVRETEDYFLHVAKKRNKKAYDLLVEQIAILKKQWNIE